MKISMNVENAALTMSQPSQVSLRLGAILDGNRHRHPLGRATIVSALLLAATAVPLLAAAQTQSDSATQTKADKAQLQFWLAMAGKTTLLTISTSGAVTPGKPESTGNTSRIDFDVSNRETVFSADSIRIERNNFVLNGNVVISVRDKSDKSKLLLQYKADSATLKTRSMDALPTYSAKSIRAGKNKTFFFTGNVVISMNDRTNKSKTLFRLEAKSATLNLGVERPGKRVSPEVAASSPKPIVIYKTKRVSPEVAASRAIYIHKSR